MKEEIERKTQRFHLVYYLTCLLAVGFFVPFTLRSADTLTSLVVFIFGDSQTLLSPSVLSVLIFSLFLCFRIRLRLWTSSKPSPSQPVGCLNHFPEAFRSICVGSSSVPFDWLNGLIERILFADEIFPPFWTMSRGMAL